MANQRAAEAKLDEAGALARSFADIAETSQRLVRDFLERQKTGASDGPLDPLDLGRAFAELTARMMADPAKLARAQMDLWQGYADLWAAATRRMMGAEAATVAAPEPGDRRFRDPAWQESQLFDFIKQSYLLTARWMTGVVRETEGLDDATARKVDFYTRQFADALAPTNFVLTNPEVLRATVESRGKNLVDGLRNLLADLERGKGRLHIRMTDLDAFKLGENIAVTPGKVVFQNELIQLIQYAPTTKQAFKKPLLIVPPWINKYYILDLRPDNSFIRWAVGEGHTVFCISWVNPDTRLAAKSFDDYMKDGLFAALDAVEKATGEREVDAIGYCLGGTLLAASLAVMAARGDARVASATYFAAMIDFAEAGELAVFIDEAQLAALEEKMAKTGYLEGADMATTFNMLRANDLIWSFVVNNYLLGKDPFPFDLLYWNSDSTRMPAAMHAYYLRKMYLENRLIEPGGITLDGTPVDLTAITTPSYVLSTREDHIAPWKSTYAAVNTYKGKTRFVLAGSGHIAGVINPPAANKYMHWTGDKSPKDPEKWLEGATQAAGSWWPDWAEWVAKFAGPKVPARTPGDGKLAVIEDAPGSYVSVRAQ
jgi:poly[(R)-3-hydroxyalkanoate] polymerase subunit PhaC